MKILISADMEGATGVTWPADVLPGTPQWERCRSMFTSDVNAAALGFYDGGADEVLVNEAHCRCGTCCWSTWTNASGC